MQIDWSTASVRFVGETGQLIVFLAEEPDRAWIRAYNAIAEREGGGKLWRKKKWGLASHAYGVGRRSVVGMFGSRPCDEEALRARLGFGRRRSKLERRTRSRRGCKTTRSRGSQSTVVRGSRTTLPDGLLMSGATTRAPHPSVAGWRRRYLKSVARHREHKLRPHRRHRRHPAAHDDPLLLSEGLTDATLTVRGHMPRRSVLAGVLPAIGTGPSIVAVALKRD
jgi:hypothetical protein